MALDVEKMKFLHSAEGDSLVSFHSLLLSRDLFYSLAFLAYNRHRSTADNSLRTYKSSSRRETSPGGKAAKLPALDTQSPGFCLDVNVLSPLSRHPVEICRLVIASERRGEWNLAEVRSDPSLSLSLKAAPVTAKLQFIRDSRTRENPNLTKQSVIAKCLYSNLITERVSPDGKCRRRIFIVRLEVSRTSREFRERREERGEKPGHFRGHEST